MATLEFPHIGEAISHWETGVHPDEADVSQATNEWFASYKLVASEKWDKVVKDNYGLMTAMCYPYTEKERLRIMNDWTTILFVYDDLFDEAASTLMNDEFGAIEASKIMLSVFTHPDTFQPDKRLPIATALHDFWSRFRATSTPIQEKRFIDTISDYAAAVHKQVGHREKKKRCTISEYITLRRQTSAVKTSIATLEYCLEIDVPDKAYRHPILEEIREIANDIVSWVNDIYSFNKEQAAGDYSNLVAVVSIEKDIPVQAAITYVYIMCKSAMDRYFELRAAVPSFDPETDEIVAKYVRGTEWTVSGLVLWTFETERYFGPSYSQVKSTNTVRILPLEADAVEPEYKLQYGIKV